MRESRYSILVAAGLLLVACQDTPVAVAPDIPSPVQAVPKYYAAPAALRVDGSYLVMFRDGVSDKEVDDDANGREREFGGAVQYRYHDAGKGYAIRLASQADAERIARDPRVLFVSEDQKVSLATVQTAAPWHLDRDDQRSRTLDKKFNYTLTASNVTAYIIDSGILTAHAEFGGRATFGFDAFNSRTSPEWGANGGDCYGHGTHVASLLGGAKYGVAKKVKLVAVRVLNCFNQSGTAIDGTTSSVIAGINFVASQKTANPNSPMVANMSLGGGANAALDYAVNVLIMSKGVPVIVSSGNDNIDACNVSPARVPAAITVGATDANDVRGVFSNYGSCVDILAPGVNVTGAWRASVSATAVLTGTSMAAPQVAGVAAMLLGAFPTATPAAIASAIIQNSTLNVVGNPLGSPNRLLFTNW